MDDSIELKQLRVVIGDRPLLKEVSVTIQARKITVLVGGSGAGKSVLLRILAGLLPKHSNPIHWDGSIAHADGRPLRNVGIVFQQFALFDELSPTGNVQFAIDHRANRKQPPQQTASQWLEELRVPWDAPVSGLSGGQRQRLAVARTLGAEPEVVLYDEPTSGLDSASSRQVAELIRRIQQNHQQTVIVVTHDYMHLLPIADQVLLLDADSKQLEVVGREQWEQVPERMQPVKVQEESSAAKGLAQRSLASLVKGAQGAIETTGAALIATARLPWDALPRWPRPIWAIRLTLHYLNLVAGLSAIFYLLVAGLIVGFVTTFFTFRYLPYSLYTKPLLLEDLLAAIGFALYRVLTPVLATTLIAARCGAAVAADVGVKRYGGQTDALRTLGIQPRAYLLVPILIAFAIGTPFLEWCAFQSARYISVLSFLSTHPQLNAHFWDLYFHSEFLQPGAWWHKGANWLLLKNLAAGIGAGTIAYHQGMRFKQSATDVSVGITSTVLWATLWTLVVHFIVAFYEFDS